MSKPKIKKPRGYRLHMDSEGCPEEIKPVLGKIVRGVWLLPDGVFISFEGGDIMEVKPVTIAHGDDSAMAAWQVRCGVSKEPGYDWGAVLDDCCERPAHLQLLTGMPFTGSHRDVLTFGHMYGIKVNMEGATFCKIPGAPDFPPTPDAAPKV